MALKLEMVSGQGWLGIPTYFSRIQVQICAFYEEAEHILRSKFHCWKRILGSRSVGAKLLFSSPWPLIQVASEAGYCNIVFLVFCGSGRDLASDRDETKRISRKYLTLRLGALSVHYYCLVIPVACVPQPQTQPLPRCITVHGNGRKPSI